ncbi:MAG TPA: hypothetical protein VHW26_00570 [Solirubrobacteraceae bacterium]|jgi:hypothetical protein|nr:hypothetical protein [Solirubrobacteraceae bacterium]
MTWTFIYLMLILKIPIGGLAWIVWWAVHETDEEPVARTEDDGGSKREPYAHPRRPRPRTPRRGPHGAPAPRPPARVRTVLAHGRRIERSRPSEHRRGGR